MVRSSYIKELKKRITYSPVVALLGSRNVGKTALAQSLKLNKTTHYLNLEDPADLVKLDSPELYLSNYKDQLVILDGIHYMPDLFPLLRRLIDDRRRSGVTTAQFLLLGSASPALLQKNSEALAGRISLLELPPLQLVEIADPAQNLNKHWALGGYPDSYQAPLERSLQWRRDFTSRYVESYFLQYGIEATPVLLRRFCTMLAHNHGETLNINALSDSLGIDPKTVKKYLELLEGLYLIRIIPPWTKSTGKRLVKAPKIYWRDTGILHSLLGLDELESILSHPICGASWEGYCIEQILNALPLGVNAMHYRTHSGAALDLVLESPNGDIAAVEIKRTLSPKISRGFTESMNTIGTDNGYIIIPKGESYPLSERVSASGLLELLHTLS